MRNYVYKSVARPYIRQILRELKEKGYKINCWYVDWGVWDIVIETCPKCGNKEMVHV